MVSNRAFPRHAHDTYGIGLLDRGAHSTCSSHGRIEAVEGDIVTVNPEEMHDGVPISNAPRKWRMLQLDPEMVRDEVGDEYDRPFEFFRPVLRDCALRSQLERMFALVTSANTQPLAVDESVSRVFMTVSDRYGAQKSRVDRAAAGIARAKERLDDEPGGAIALAELAAMAGLSRFQLIRSFAREVGVTPYAYQVQSRVRLARKLIASGAALSDVAATAGFSDQSHMCRAFVRQMGVTPARYRDAKAGSAQ